VIAPGDAAATPAPAGLLVDFGGVLTNPLAPVMRTFCRAKGIAEEAILQAMTPGSPLKPGLDAYERGELDDEEFARRLAAHLGITVADIDELWADLALDERMFRLVDDIRRHGIRTCLVSNSWGLDVYPRERLAASFDAVVISGEVGMRKPDPGIYLHAAAVIAVPPGRCVLVDDSGANLAGATAVGMRAVHHTGAETTARELERLLGIGVARVSSSAF
jgi:epoxide hydrolase-like predicted phosphatase